MHGDPFHVLVLGDGAEATAQQLCSEGIQATHGVFTEIDGFLVVNGTQAPSEWPSFTHVIHLGPNGHIRSNNGTNAINDVQWVTKHCGVVLKRAIVLVSP